MAFQLTVSIDHTLGESCIECSGRKLYLQQDAAFVGSIGCRIDSEAWGPTEVALHNLNGSPDATSSSFQRLHQVLKLDVSVNKSNQVQQNN